MGFWSTLAGIGTSLIPGVGPLLAPLVSGGISALTGGGGSSSNAPGTTEQKSVDLGAYQKDPNVQEGLDTLQQPKKYFQTALGGSQEAAQGLLGPQVSTVLDQYDNAAKTASELGPRGGGRTAVLAEAPFKKAAAYGQALAGARTGAASGLTDIGKAEADIGGGEEGRQSQFKLGQGNLNLGQNRLAFEGQQAKAKSYADIGSGIGNILTRIITGAKGGGSQKGTDWSNLSPSGDTYGN